MSKTNTRNLAPQWLSTAAFVLHLHATRVQELGWVAESMNTALTPYYLVGTLVPHTQLIRRLTICGSTKPEMATYTPRMVRETRMSPADVRVYAQRLWKLLAKIAHYAEGDLIPTYGDGHEHRSPTLLTEMEFALLQELVEDSDEQ